jgi:hypothetical protein
LGSMVQKTGPTEMRVRRGERRRASLLQKGQLS